MILTLGGDAPRDHHPLVARLIAAAAADDGAGLVTLGDTPPGHCAVCREPADTGLLALPDGFGVDVLLSLCRDCALAVWNSPGYADLLPDVLAETSEAE